MRLGIKRTPISIKYSVAIEKYEPALPHDVRIQTLISEVGGKCVTTAPPPPQKKN